MKRMGFNRRKCFFCKAILPKEMDDKLTVRCLSCHMTMGICSICGNVQDPQILHPFGVDKRTGKTIQVCCSRCFEEAEKKFEIDWAVSVRYKDVSRKKEVLPQRKVELTLVPREKEVRPASSKGFNDVGSENLESVLFYDDLPEHFTERAKNLFPAVKKLFPGLSLKDWINRFKYSLYPERELAKWEDRFKQYDRKRAKNVSPKTKGRIWTRILAKMNKENYEEIFLREDRIKAEEDEEDSLRRR